MKYLILLFVMVIGYPAYAQQLAFPTAEGWGRFASGGRGNGSTGVVCHVDNLGTTSSGNQIAGTPHFRGTWLYCITRAATRTVVFDVAGQVNMGGQAPNLTNGNMTIAGQTAPGNGFDIRYFMSSFRSNNHIVRYARMRPGAGGSSYKALEVRGDTGNADNMIFDHLSITFSPDDSVGIWVGANDITLQWSLIAQGLPPACSGCYSKSSLVGAGATRVSFHHNLHAHHKERGPYLQSGDFQQVNDVFYNFKDFSIAMATLNTVAMRAEFINNHMKLGPSADPQSPMALTHFGCNGKAGGATSYPCYPTMQAASSYYLSGNFHTTRRPTGAEPEIALTRNTPPWPVYEFTLNASPYGTFPSITTTTHQQAYTDVLNNAGARIPFFANADSIIVNDVINGTGLIHRTITSSDYDTIPYVERDPNTYDTDWDGIPNTWETQCGSLLGGLSPSNSNDGNDIVSGINSTVNGYSKLEVYLNAVAGDYGSNGVSTCAGLSGADTNPPTTPTLSSPTVISTTQIDLSWTAATDASGIGDYVVTYCEDADQTADCTPNIDISSGAGDLTHSHTGLQASTIYGYQVRAIDTPGNQGAKSTPIQYATTDDPPGPDITTGLVSHWALDSALTDAGSANATLSAVGSPTYVGGRISNAIDLNGTSQYLTTADNASHDFGTSTDFSFALWIQADASTKQFLLSKVQSQGGSSDGGWSMELVSGTGKVLAGITSDAWNNYCSVSSSTNLVDGSWHHIAVNVIRGASCTLSSIELYVDGVLDTSRTLTLSNANSNANISNDDPLWIGAEHASGSPTSLLNGRIDDVRVYNRILASEDVQALVDLGDIDTDPPTDVSNLVATPFLDDMHSAVFMTWDASTDNIGPITYRVQRCEGNGCSDFTNYDTSLFNNYSDIFVAEHQYYRYRVRAEDAVPNVSNYTSPVQILTLYSVNPPLSPSTLTTSYSGSVAFPSAPINVATTANSTVSGFSGPINLSTTAGSTVTFPSPPTGVTSP